MEEVRGWRRRGDGGGRDVAEEEQRGGREEVDEEVKGC